MVTYVVVIPHSSRPDSLGSLDRFVQALKERHFDQSLRVLDLHAETSTGPLQHFQEFCLENLERLKRLKENTLWGRDNLQTTINLNEVVLKHFPKAVREGVPTILTQIFDMQKYKMTLPFIDKLLSVVDEQIAEGLLVVLSAQSASAAGINLCILYESHVGALLRLQTHPKWLKNRTAFALFCDAACQVPGFFSAKELQDTSFLGAVTLMESKSDFNALFASQPASFSDEQLLRLCDHLKAIDEAKEPMIHVAHILDTIARDIGFSFDKMSPRVQASIVGGKASIFKLAVKLCASAQENTAILAYVQGLMTELYAQPKDRLMGPELSLPLLAVVHLIDYCPPSVHEYEEKKPGLLHLVKQYLSPQCLDWRNQYRLGCGLPSSVSSSVIILMSGQAASAATSEGASAATARM